MDYGIKISIPWTPDEFVEQARKLVHLFGNQAIVNDRADRAIFDNLTAGCKKIERDPARPTLIRTVRGIGYMMTEGAAPVPQDPPSTS